MEYAKTRGFNFGRWIGVGDDERRVMGGGDEGKATMGEASKDMPRGRHLTVVYPALFSLVLCGFHRQFAFYS